MSWSCNDCGNFDKSKKYYNETNFCYYYKCLSNGRICGWCRTDKELKDMGCGRFIDKKEAAPKQLSLFELMEELKQ